MKFLTRSARRKLRRHRPAELTLEVLEDRRILSSLNFAASVPQAPVAGMHTPIVVMAPPSDSSTASNSVAAATISGGAILPAAAGLGGALPLSARSLVVVAPLNASEASLPAWHIAPFQHVSPGGPELASPVVPFDHTFVEARGATLLSAAANLADALPAPGRTLVLPLPLGPGHAPAVEVLAPGGREYVLTLWWGTSLGLAERLISEDFRLARTEMSAGRDHSSEAGLLRLGHVEGTSLAFIALLVQRGSDAKQMTMAGKTASGLPLLGDTPAAQGAAEIFETAQADTAPPENNALLIATPSGRTVELPLPARLGLIANLVAPDTEALDGALRQFLAGLDACVEEVVTAPVSAGLTPWISATALAAFAGEFVRQQLKGSAPGAALPEVAGQRTSGLRHHPGPRRG
jgi:hypothetical protein